MKARPGGGGGGGGGGGRPRSRLYGGPVIMVLGAILGVPNYNMYDVTVLPLSDIASERMIVV